MFLSPENAEKLKQRGVDNDFRHLEWERIKKTSEKILNTDILANQLAWFPYYETTVHLQLESGFWAFAILAWNWPPLPTEYLISMALRARRKLLSRNQFFYDV